MKRTHEEGTPINPVSRKMGFGEYIKDGMDDIAYFAAHAPDTPSWFKVEKTPYPEKPVPSTDTAVNAWNKELDMIEQINTERRYFQWRWYYAEQMVAHRGRD